MMLRVNMSFLRESLMKTIKNSTHTRGASTAYGYLNPWQSGKLQVVIETAKGTRNKFSYDPDNNSFVLKKVLPRGMDFPFDYGFVPCCVPQQPAVFCADYRQSRGSGSREFCLNIWPAHRSSARWPDVQRKLPTPGDDIPRRKLQIAVAHSTAIIRAENCRSSWHTARLSVAVAPEILTPRFSGELEI